MTLRVLHVIYDDPDNPWVAGGGGVRVRELYRRLAGTVDATVATGRYPGARDGLVDGVRYLRLGASRPYAWSRLTHALAANRLLRTASYDAAVFDFSGYSPVFVPRDRPAGITVHHLTGPTAGARWGRPAGALLSWLERAMLRRAARFSATASATRVLLADIAPGVPIDDVGAGVPDANFTAPRAPAGFLLCFGRLDVFQKGLDVALDAFALLAAERPALRLRIAGRGRDTERIRALAERLGLTSRVDLVGAVDDDERRRLLAGAEVQLMPSRFEGFGLAAAEAMAAGVPLVASDAGALPEVVDPPHGGRVVPAGDADALARAVAALLDDADSRAALSASARQSAARFRWDVVADAHLAFLRSLAASRGARPSIPHE